jgi:alginate O-acetyltransferase complex protein AlgI
MSFNSYAFIFAFLPTALAGCLWLGARFGRTAGMSWLVLMCVVFYIASSPVTLALILPAILLDYWIGRCLLATPDEQQRTRTAWFTLGVVINIALLCYFKYKNFFLGTANDLLGAQFELKALLLPLGISFLTFQKIAFLADAHSRQIQSLTLLDFLAFTLFFPRTVAGPIVHYQEVMPQLDSGPRVTMLNVAVGVALFAIGLFKKTVLADGVSQYALGVVSSDSLTLTTSWIALLAYTFQLYFDFSGYSDMALGVARMFGVRLPMNFNSPFKASSIVDFWSRWHITLTRFLTAYIYTPMLMSLTRRRMAKDLPVLKGKKTKLSAIVVLIGGPTILTMAVSGLWHGAGFQFIVWGLLHGVFLTVNQGWRIVRPRFWSDQASYERVMKPLGWLLTFLCVVVALVFFRANSLGEAMHILASMIGLNGTSLPIAVVAPLGIGELLASFGIQLDFTSGSEFIASITWLIVLFFIVLKLPNSLDLMRRFEPALDFQPVEPQAAPIRTVRWAPAEIALTSRSAIGISLLTVAGLVAMGRTGVFLYWQF